LLLYIYRYEIRLFIKYGFSDTKKEKDIAGIAKVLKNGLSTSIDELKEKELNTKVEGLLDKFNELPLELGIDSQEEDKVSVFQYTPPIFRRLKTIKSENEIAYHFVNDGGGIYNFNIYPKKNSHLMIEPQNDIRLKGSGFIKFLFSEKLENEFYFDISYFDAANEFHKERYCYSISKDEIVIL
jgi:hypothetical protein